MAKTLKLISNSGIQFENINIKINEDFNKKNKIFYLEEFHVEKEIFWFEQVIKNRKDDIWIRKSELQVKGFLDVNEEFTEDYSIDEIQGVDEEMICILELWTFLLSIFEIYLLVLNQWCSKYLHC